MAENISAAKETLPCTGCKTCVGAHFLAVETRKRGLVESCGKVPNGLSSSNDLDETPELEVLACSFQADYNDCSVSFILLPWQPLPKSLITSKLILPVPILTIETS